MNKRFLILTTAVAFASLAASAAVSCDRGGWKIAFDETTSVLKLAFPAKNITLEGRLSFVSQGVTWRVGEPRDAATDRLTLVAGKGSSVSSYGAGTVYG